MQHAPDSFAVRLIKAQNLTGKRNRDICAETGLNSSTYSQLRTSRMPDPKTLVKICRALGCSADYLLGLTDDPQVRTA